MRFDEREARPVSPLGFLCAVMAGCFLTAIVIMVVALYAAEGNGGEMAKTERPVIVTTTHRGVFCERY